MSQYKKQPESDISKMLNTAVGGITGMVGDLRNQINSKIETYLTKMDLVKREEFEVVKEMLLESRREQQKLVEKIQKLEESIKK